MMSHQEEYGALLTEYHHDKCGLRSVLQHITCELESISSMIYTTRNSIENQLAACSERRVLLLAGNKAYQLTEEVRLLNEALHTDDTTSAGGVES